MPGADGQQINSRARISVCFSHLGLPGSSLQQYAVKNVFLRSGYQRGTLVEMILAVSLQQLRSLPT